MNGNRMVETNRFYFAIALTTAAKTDEGEDREHIDMVNTIFISRLIIMHIFRIFITMAMTA